MIEVSGTGSVPLTNGFGFGRPKNIQIRNTESIYFFLSFIVVATGVMVYTSILVVFLGVGGLLGYCGYRSVFLIWICPAPELLYWADLIRIRSKVFFFILGLLYFSIVSSE